MAFIACLIAMSLFSCSDNEEEPEVLPEISYETSVAISEAEYVDKVCGKVWELASREVIHTDDEKTALPFYEDFRLDKWTRTVFFQRDTLTTIILKMLNYYVPCAQYKDAIHYNASNGYICLENGAKLAKIVYVSKKTMMTIECNGINKEGVHEYALCTYRVASKDWEEQCLKALTKIPLYKDYEGQYIRDEHGEFVPRSVLEDRRISKELFFDRVLTHHWMYRRGREIFDDGTVCSRPYPYGWEYGTRRDFYFPTDSTITVVEMPLRGTGEKTENTYLFTYSTDDNELGCHNVRYHDDLHNCDVLIKFEWYFCYRYITADQTWKNPFSEVEYFDDDELRVSTNIDGKYMWADYTSPELDAKVVPDDWNGEE